MSQHPQAKIFTLSVQEKKDTQRQNKGRSTEGEYYEQELSLGWKLKIHWHLKSIVMLFLLQHNLAKTNKPTVGM